MGGEGLPYASPYMARGQYPPPWTWAAPGSMGGAPADATGSSGASSYGAILPKLVSVHKFYGADGPGVWREGGWFSGMDSGDQIPGTREAEE
jgi:hypothetical protein